MMQILSGIWGRTGEFATFAWKKKDRGNMGEAVRNRIEEAVCRRFGIPAEDIRTVRNLDRRFTDCLHFIWFYRHFAEGITFGRLSSEYGRSVRNIKYAVSKIANGMRTQPYYKEVHLEILEEIIRGEDGSPVCLPGEKKE